MKYTSAEANKLLKKLNEEHDYLLRIEGISSTFTAASTEDENSVRPDYDYSKTQEKLTELEEKIRKVKHAINSFNISHSIPKYNMTVDQILVYIPQLTAAKRKLLSMKQRIPKQRARSIGQVIDYIYTNYDISKVSKDLDRITTTLSEVQTALDILNNNETMEIDIE